MVEENLVYRNVNTLLKALFEREDIFLARQEKSMIQKHVESGGSTDGFRHMGILYSPLEGTARSMGNYQCLHVSLIPEMDKIRAEKATIEADKERVRQALTLVLRQCKTYQDMRDALPNAMRDFLPGIQKLDRTRPEAWTLIDTPVVYKQYQKLREKIDFYTAARLLY